jgi:hypothetical protein
MCGCGWRSGKDDCHDEMVDARPGVKYRWVDWWPGRDVTVAEEDVELSEADERVDLEDMVASYKFWLVGEICIVFLKEFVTTSKRTACAALVRYIF